MKMSATRFRQDLFKTLDRLVETGETLEIERRGAVLRVQVARAAGALLDTARFAHRRQLLRVPPAELVSSDWSSLWRHEGGFEPPAGKASPKAEALPKARTRVGLKRAGR